MGRRSLDNEPAEFWAWLATECPKHAIDPVALVGLVMAECDGFSVKNRYGYAGYSQLGSRELTALGWPGGAFELASGVTQFGYTFKYFDNWRRRKHIDSWRDAGHLWVVNLAPAWIDRPNRLLYSEKEHPTQYRANKWCDVDGDGVISQADLQAAIGLVITGQVPGRESTAGMYQRCLAKLNAHTLANSNAAHPSNDDDCVVRP